MDNTSGTGLEDIRRAKLYNLKSFLYTDLSQIILYIMDLLGLLYLFLEVYNRYDQSWRNPSSILMILAISRIYGWYAKH